MVCTLPKIVVGLHMKISGWSDMSYNIVATCYNSVVVELINHEIGISKAFTQLEVGHH